MLQIEYFLIFKLHYLTKLNINKKLTSINGSNKNKSNKNVQHLHFTTVADEIEGVVKVINKIKTENDNITWDDFAILVRANNHAEPFINYFEKKGIPYEFLASSGLYRQPLILDCVSYFRTLKDVRDNTAVFRLLCLSALNFSSDDLQKITYYAKRKSVSYYQTIKNPELIGISAEGAKKCLKLFSIIDEGLQMSTNKKPSIILYNFLDKSNYLELLAKSENSGDREIIKQILHLKQFFEYLDEYESTTNDHNLSNFLDNYELMSEAGEKGDIYQPGETPDSINILTIHAAKGLEFKYVFIVNLVEDRFPSRRRGVGIEIPDELIKEKLPSGDVHIEEERRLFYVGITRAKEKLFFTSSANYGGERQKKISRFLKELGFDGTLTEKSIPEINLAETNIKQKSVLKMELPETFSFSQIRSFETCPYQYKLAHILKIPVRGNASFSFGQSIHKTLQLFYQRIIELNSAYQSSLFENKEYKKNNSTGLLVPEIDEMLKIYEESFIDDWYKNEEQKNEYFAEGKKILRQFYSSQNDNWTIPAELESWFKIKVGKYYLHGRIDRIDQKSDGSLEIIDYKTGKSKDKLNLDDKEQLYIYQIAAESLDKFRSIGKTSSLTYYYVNDGKKLSFLGNQEELEKLKLKIIETIDDINKMEFNAKPSQFSCDYCDFKNICEFRI